jgi:hypothetical protein
MVLASEMLKFTVDELKSLDAYSNDRAEVYKTFWRDLTQYIETYNQM